MRAAVLAVAVLLLAGCVGGDAPSPTALTPSATATDTTSPSATTTASPTGAPAEEVRIPMLLVQRSFAPVEGKFHAYDQVQHCPTVGHHVTGRWFVRLAPGNATPMAGMGETWNFTNVHWVATTGGASGDLFWGPREVPLKATFGAERFGVLAFNGTGFRLDGQPLQDGARRTLTYGAVDDDGQTRLVTETLAFHPFPAADVTIDRPAHFMCI